MNEDFTAALIFGAMRFGVKVELGDLALHTLLNVMNYVQKVVPKDEQTNTPTMSLSDLGSGKF